MTPLVGNQGVIDKARHFTVDEVSSSIYQVTHVTHVIFHQPLQDIAHYYSQTLPTC